MTFSFLTAFADATKNPASVLFLVARLGRKELATQLTDIASCVEAFRSAIATKDRKSARQEYGRYRALIDGLWKRMFVSLDDSKNRELNDLLGSLSDIDRRVLEEEFLGEEETGIERRQLFLDKLDDAIGTLRGTAESIRNLT